MAEQPRGRGKSIATDPVRFTLLVDIIFFEFGLKNRTKLKKNFGPDDRIRSAHTADRTIVTIFSVQRPESLLLRSLHTETGLHVRSNTKRFVFDRHIFPVDRKLFSGRQRNKIRSIGIKFPVDLFSISGQIFYFLNYFL